MTVAKVVEVDRGFWQSYRQIQPVILHIYHSHGENIACIWVVSRHQHVN